MFSGTVCPRSLSKLLYRLDSIRCKSEVPYVFSTIAEFTPKINILGKKGNDKKNYIKCTYIPDVSLYYYLSKKK